MNTGSSIYRSRLLWMLLIVNALNFLDRQIVNILAEPIKRDLLLADWQMGALSGFAFAIFYTVLGLPIARLAERYDRSRIISAALFVWSGFTALSGFANSYLQLLLARIGVGIGEAGCSPPAQALIADATPKSRRAAALAFYAMGIPIGSLLGMTIGGFVAQAWGWRAAFLIVGLPGLAFAVFTAIALRDPRAPVVDGATTGTEGSVQIPTTGVALQSLLAARSFRWMALAAALLTFVSYAHQAFFGSFFLRTHAGQLEQLAEMWGTSGAISFLGLALGLILGIGGLLGVFLGGRICDRYASKHASAYAMVPAIASLVAGPLFAITFLLPSAAGALLLLVIPIMLKSVWFGPVFAAVQGLVHVRSRATATAALIFIVNAVGLGLGPLCTGLLSDALSPEFGEAAGLKWAMVTVSAVAVLAAYCFFQARRTLANDIIT